MSFLLVQGHVLQMKLGSESVVDGTFIILCLSVVATVLSEVVPEQGICFQKVERDLWILVSSTNLVLLLLECKAKMYYSSTN